MEDNMENILNNVNAASTTIQSAKPVEYVELTNDQLLSILQGDVVYEDELTKGVSQIAANPSQDIQMQDIGNETLLDGEPPHQSDGETSDEAAELDPNQLYIVVEVEEFTGNEEVDVENEQVFVIMPFHEALNNFLLFDEDGNPLVNEVNEGIEENPSQPSNELLANMQIAEAADGSYYLQPCVNEGYVNEGFVNEDNEDDSSG